MMLSRFTDRWSRESREGPESSSGWDKISEVVVEVWLTASSMFTSSSTKLSSSMVRTGGLRAAGWEKKEKEKEKDWKEEENSPSFFDFILFFFKFKI